MEAATHRNRAVVTIKIKHNWGEWAADWKKVKSAQQERWY